MSEDKDQTRFLSYVQKDDSTTGCWRWCGSKAITGYSNFFYRGTTYLAHRASLLIFKKVVNLTPGLQVAHSCGNRDCVNPDHLSEKSRSENNGIDKREHGKDLSGDKCHFAKLDWDKVAQIRHKSSEGVSNKSLSEEFRVSPSTVSSIVRNKTWKLE